MLQDPYTACLIVPTGIGCAIGGYAGDALPVARLLASCVDCLITHPNVLNGAQLYWPISNALYVEGYALDQFAAGNWGLMPIYGNRIGLVFDQGIESDLLTRHLQAAEAVRATLGLQLTDYVITDQPLQVELVQTASGTAWGTVQNLGSALRAAQQLITTAGAEAIAIVARFPDDDPSDEALTKYRQGQGVDPIAGTEAIISHAIVREFQIPCAHAPALQPLPLDPTISPRSAAEEIGYTFLPCVLAGLSRAPHYHSLLATEQSDRALLTTDQVDVVIAPASAMGGPAILQWASRGVPIIAVAENTTTLNVYPELLNLKVIAARSYLEAVGIITALKAGLDPSSTTAQTRRLNRLSNMT